MKLINLIAIPLLKLFDFVCRILPSQRAISKVGRVLGGINFLLQRRRKAIALNNLELIFGDEWSAEKRNQVARTSFDNVAVLYFEGLWEPEKHGVEFDEWARCEGLEHLEAAHQQGKGVVLACPHLGNWVVLARAITRHGYRFDGLMRAPDIPAMRDYVDQKLTTLGFRPTYTPLPKGGFSKIIDQLGDQGTVFVMVADRRANDYLVDFLGQPAWTAHGAVTMHLRSGAPIVTAYAVREGDHHRLIFEPAIVHEPTDDRDADTVAILKQINDRFSAMIRQHPEQWLWMHERWRGRRKGQKQASAEAPAVDTNPNTDTNKELDAVDK